MLRVLSESFPTGVDRIIYDEYLHGEIPQWRKHHAKKMKLVLKELKENVGLIRDEWDYDSITYDYRRGKVRSWKLIAFGNYHKYTWAVSFDTFNDLNRKEKIYRDLIDAGDWTSVFVARKSFDIKENAMPRRNMSHEQIELIRGTIIDCNCDEDTNKTFDFLQQILRDRAQAKNKKRIKNKRR